LEVHSPFVLLKNIFKGCFVGFGAYFACNVAGDLSWFSSNAPGIQRMIFGANFSVALMLIIFTGTELFTGNCMALMPGFVSRKAGFLHILKNFVIVYFGNWAGCCTVAFFFIWIPYYHYIGTDSLPGWISFIIRTAEKKTSYEFFQIFFLAIPANWLVCLSVWMAYVAESSTGKVLGCIFPVMAFAALGFEHAIANMFIIPCAMMMGASISFGRFIYNLVLATAGNIIGGGIMMGFFLWYIHKYRQENKNLIEGFFRSLFLRGKCPCQKKGCACKKNPVINTQQDDLVLPPNKESDIETPITSPMQTPVPGSEGHGLLEGVVINTEESGIQN
jgi:formate/nitrite transporter